MSTVRFISDLHLGHNKILEFSRPFRKGNTVEEHDQWIVDQWNSVVGKRDVTYVLGDVAFSREALAKLSLMRGMKRLILGNHDRFPLEEYGKYFISIHGFTKKYGAWLSHCPINPDELRGKFNIHGHVHHNSIQDPRYFNACVENLNGVPISNYDIWKELDSRGITP